MYMLNKKRRLRREFQACPHIAIVGNNLYYNVSFEDIMECENPDRECDWNSMRLREADQVLMQVNVFGTNRLYKLVDPNILREYDKRSKVVVDPDTERPIYTENQYVTPDDPTGVAVFFWSLMDIDTAPAKGINLKTEIMNSSHIFSPGQALELHIQRGIVNGLNQFYELNGMPTRANIGFSKCHLHDDGKPVYDEYGCLVEEPDGKAFYTYNQIDAAEVLAGEVDFDSIIPDFNPKGYEPGKYKFIIDAPNQRVTFSNNLLTSEFNHLFVYIPEFDLWQEIRRDELITLQRMCLGKITYSRVDDPHCFSKIFYSSEFTADSIETLLFNAIAIPVDIRWHGMFYWQRTDMAEKKTYWGSYEGNEDNIGTYIPNNPREYEALTFDLSCYQYNINLTLTQEELGIGNNGYHKRQDTGIPDLPGSYGYRNADFWMLGLLIQILNLRPTLGDQFTDGAFYD